MARWYNIYSFRTAKLKISAEALASILVVATLAIGACSGKATQSLTPGGGRGGAQAAVPVTVTTVTQKAVPLQIDAIGTAEAFSTVAMHSQITGQLMSVAFQEGDDVHEGQVLFTLDRRPLESALLQAQANLERDSVQAENAKSEAARYQRLAELGIATSQQVDQTRTTVATIAATIGADRAAIESAKVQLQYATITAPLDGRTGALMVHSGNLVRANDTMPLVVINQVSPIYVSFGIPEDRLADLKGYMAHGVVSVEARLPNDTGPAATGRITFVDNTVDPTTGTIRVKGSFLNQGRRLWPGQFVNVLVTLRTDENAIVVPSRAVQTRQQGPYVFVVKPDRTVDLRAVHVMRTAGNDVLIKDGLTPGETIVIDGQLRLVRGSSVSIKQDNEEGSTSEAP
jgi:membrane fusion protein, multidrug efflux system